MKTLLAPLGKLVRSSDKCRDNMAAVLRVVVEWPVEVSRHDADEICAELFIVQATLHLAHALSEGVPFV